MSERPHRMLDRTTIRIVLIYAAAAAVWIPLTDRLLQLWKLDAETLTRFQAFKEWLFVIVSALLLAWLIQRHVEESQRERRQTEETLSTHLNQISTVFDAINAVIYVCDMDTNQIIYLNRFGESLYGSNWQGQICHAFIHQEPEEYCEFCKRDQLVIDGVPQPPCITEFRNGRNGRWYQRIDRAIRWTDGSLVRMELLIDINEQRALERVKDDMISSVSHEMQTPLTAMMGFTEFLLEHPTLPAEEQKNCLETLCRETSRLNDLIGAFLDLQRMQAQAMTYDFRTLDLEALLREAATLYAGSSRVHQVSLDLAVHLPPVWGDEGRLAQVFGNLLSNAIKYSPQGGRVVLAAHQAGGSVEVSVRDEGLGISADARERIFDRFYRIDNSDRRRIGGAGIGLALVKEFVTAHGGSIRVDSVPGEGSTFIVVLPVASQTEDSTQDRNMVPDRLPRLPPQSAQRALQTSDTEL